MILARSLPLLLCMVFASLAGDARASLRIVLKDTAVAPRRQFTLGDIATVTADDTGLAAQVAATPVGTGPRPGQVSAVTRAGLQRLLRSRGLPADAVWEGAQTVKLETASRSYPGAALTARAHAYLESLLAGHPRVHVRSLDQVADLELPDGEVALLVRPMTPAQAQKRRVAVWLDVMLDRVFYKSQAVAFAVEAYRPALVARRDLAKGQLFDCADVEMRVIDVAALVSAAVPGDCARLGGPYRLHTPVAAGTAVPESALQILPAVIQGQSISLQLNEGAFQLEARALALTDGVVGQQIPVKPSGSDQTVLARVTAPGQATITRR